MDSANPLPPTSDDDRGLVERLRAHDEAAFRTLLGRYHRATVRLAAAYVTSEAVAEEVAQEAWMAALRGIAGFEGRSTFKGWLFRIVANTAKKRASREARSIPLSDLAGDEGDDGPAVDPGRFETSGRWVGHWSAPPEAWDDAEERLLAGEARAILRRAIEALPPLQRQVITIRDVEECTSEEACEILGITEANQRVLLHRARSRLRQTLETHLRGDP